MHETLCTHKAPSISLTKHFPMTCNRGLPGDEVRGRLMLPADETMRQLRKLSTSLPVLALLLVIAAMLGGCFAARGMSEIRSFPYPIVYEDEVTERFSDADTGATIEVRKARISRPLENLAIHYQAIFPGGEIIRPGDHEEYVKIGDRNAYRVVYRLKYIRKRKRMDDKGSQDQVPTGWTKRSVEDPNTGKPMQVLYGPIVPQQKVLYLVEGPEHLYYVLLTADGDSIEAARKKFEKFVREGIQYL